MSATDVLDVVVELLEAGGDEAVQLRVVARRARVSLSTLYKQYPSRDHLLAAALASWLDTNGYATLSPRRDDEALGDFLVRVFRGVFGPWEQHPRLLAAYHRAQSRPGAEVLARQGSIRVEPMVRAALAELDADLARDVEDILVNMAYAGIGRVSSGDLPIEELLPMLERSVRRLLPTTPATALGSELDQGSLERPFR